MYPYGAGNKSRGRFGRDCGLMPDHCKYWFVSLSLNLLMLNTFAADNHIETLIIQKNFALLNELSEADFFKIGGIRGLKTLLCFKVGCI